MTDIVDLPSKGIFPANHLHSAETDQVAAALAQFQASMPVLDKTGRNFTKGSAATIGDVVSVAKRAAKHGLAFSQPVTKFVRMDAPTEYAVRTYVYHTSGQWISGGEVPVIANKQNDAAAFGAGLTYARKYSLQTVMGIADHNDEDIDWSVEITDGTDRNKKAGGNDAHSLAHARETAGQGGSSAMHLQPDEPPASNTMRALGDSLPNFDRFNFAEFTPDEVKQFFEGLPADQVRKEIAPVKDLTVLRRVMKALAPQDADVVAAFVDQSKAIEGNA